MATYVHNRAFKTKREEYEEKLKQRNENEQWIFGNTFGRPGGGAPLRDKNGNVVSNLKTISNGNIFKYDAQEFTKGDNNVYSINHKIYDANVNKVINDPFTPFRNYINQFDPNNNVNKNINIDNNQGYLIPDNNININQNPYLIQLPDGNYGILSPYPLIQPMPNINLNNINYPINNNFSINENIKEEIPQQQRPYSSINLNEINNYNANNTNISNIDNNNINNKINTDINNISNNLNNTQYKTSITGAPRKKKKKIPESTLFNEAAQERVKLEKERKNKKKKKELLDQIKEKRRRDEIKRKEMEEKEKREELENEKYIKFKKKQREEHAKKIKEEQEKRLRERMQSNQSQSVVNILDLSNNIDQANKSIMSNNNITFREGNLNELSQNNLNINNNENEENNNIQILNNNNLEINNYNSIYNPIQENFKNEINRQYNLLNETLNHDINKEMERISKELESNYTPFTQKLLLMNTYSKSRSDLTMEQNRKLKKIENMIEEKKLVDYVLGNRKRPPSPKEDDNENIEMPIPSYFGTNRDKAENKYLGLHSKSSFINKGENISNFIASGRNQNIGTLITQQSSDQNIQEKNRINNMYNFAMQNDVDLNYVNDYYSNNKFDINTGKGTFGTNIQKDENLGGVVNSSQNLDNISVFIPLNKDRENINIINEKRMRPISIKENRIRDKDMENMFKDLDEIYKLTNKIDVTSKAKNISDKYIGELSNIQNREKTLKKYYEQKDEYDDNIENKNNVNNKKNINNRINIKDKITEEASKLSKTSTNKTKSNQSKNINNEEKNYSRDDDNNINIINNNEKISENHSNYTNKTKESKPSKKSREDDNNLNQVKNSKESYLSSDLKSETEKEREKEGQEKINDNNNKEEISEDNKEEEIKGENINNDNDNNNNKEELNEEKNEKEKGNILEFDHEVNENKKEPEIIETNNKNKTEGNEEEEEEDDEDVKE